MVRLIASCPACRGNRLFLTRYEPVIQLLKDRNWLYCKDCEYEIETDKFKEMLWCA